MFFLAFCFFFIFLLSLTCIKTAFAFERTQIYTSASKDNPIFMEINNPEIAITSIKAYPYSYFTNILLNVTDKEDVSGVADNPIAFFEVGCTIPNSEINVTKITFRVLNDYIVEHNLKRSSIYLAKFDDNWQMIRTLQTSEDNNYTYYSAQTDGFYLFEIAGKQFDVVSLGSYKESVIAGKTLLIPIKISNLGTESRQFEVSMSPVGTLMAYQVEGMGVNNPGKFTIKPKSNETIYISLLTDKDAKEAKYDFEIVVKGDETKILQGKFNLINANLAQTESFTIEKLFDNIEGTNNRIKVTVRNSGSVANRYFIDVKDVDSWAEYEITPNPVLFLESGQIQIAYVNIYPIKGLENSSKTFSVEISDGQKPLKVESFTTSVVFPPKVLSNNNIENQVIILVTLLLIVFAIIFPIIRKSRKEKY